MRDTSECAIIDIGRNPALAFGQWITHDYCGAIRTGNRSLWVVGNVRGKVAMPGRWVAVEEIAMFCGVDPGDLDYIERNTKRHFVLGNMIPVPMAAAVLGTILKAVYGKA